MNDHAHRNFQNLPKIGPVYSTKDEKQRVIAEEIINYRIRPELKLKINMNITGLDKKKIISPINPETRRLTTRLSYKGKEGWLYIWTYPNIARFFVPSLCVAFLYFAGESLITARYNETENNYELETCYTKMQIVKTHYYDRWSLMA
jgi:hypothetical protein